MSGGGAFHFPYELLLHIAKYCRKLKTIESLSSVCRATRPLFSDEQLFEHLYHQLYGGGGREILLPAGWSWKELCTLLHGFLKNLPYMTAESIAKAPMQCIPFRALVPCDEVVSLNSLSHSCLGYSLSRLPCIGKGGDFIPLFVGVFGYRKAKLNFINFENRAREIKRRIETEVILGEQEYEQAPFDNVLFVDDGLCVWNGKEYKVVCNMQRIYEYCQRKHFIRMFTPVNKIQF